MDAKVEYDRENCRKKVEHSAELLRSLAESLWVAPRTREQWLRICNRMREANGEITKALQYAMPHSCPPPDDADQGEPVKPTREDARDA